VAPEPAGSQDGSEVEARSAPPNAVSSAGPSDRRTDNAKADLRALDLTQEVARAFVHDSQATGGEPTAIVADPRVGYADPLAVARAYVATRLTYRSDDPTGYRAAVTAPRLATSALAARSQPNTMTMARLAESGEVSTVRVGTAELETEAPNDNATKYVTVSCTVTTTYRGGSATTPAAWSLRLLQVSPAHWRVDGVLSTQ
jgi:hypothetical protein